MDPPTFCCRQHLWMLITTMIAAFYEYIGPDVYFYMYDIYTDNILPVYQNLKDFAVKILAWKLNNPRCRQSSRSLFILSETCNYCRRFNILKANCTCSSSANERFRCKYVAHAWKWMHHNRGCVRTRPTDADTLGCGYGNRIGCTVKPIFRFPRSIDDLPSLSLSDNKCMLGSPFLYLMAHFRGHEHGMEMYFRIIQSFTTRHSISQEVRGVCNNIAPPILRVIRSHINMSTSVILRLFYLRQLACLYKRRCFHKKYQATCLLCVRHREYNYMSKDELYDYICTLFYEDIAYVPPKPVPVLNPPDKSRIKRKGKKPIYTMYGCGHDLFRDAAPGFDPFSL